MKYCPHLLCCRSESEITLADAPCVLDDCPLHGQAEPEQRLSPLAKAVRDARGGEAPIQFRGFA